MIAVVRLYHGHIAALTAAVKAPVAKGVHHLTGIYILVQAAVFGVVVRRIVLLYITGLAVLAVQPVQAGILGAVLAVRSGNGHLLVLQGGLGHIQLGGVTGSLIGFLVEIGGGIRAAQSSEVGAVASS